MVVVVMAMLHGTILMHMRVSSMAMRERTTIQGITTHPRHLQ